jgi:hypothetical protein
MPAGQLWAELRDNLNHKGHEDHKEFKGRVFLFFPNLCELRALRGNNIF